MLNVQLLFGGFDIWVDRLSVFVSEILNFEDLDIQLDLNLITAIHQDSSQQDL